LAAQHDVWLLVKANPGCDVLWQHIMTQDLSTT